MLLKPRGDETTQDLAGDQIDVEWRPDLHLPAATTAIGFIWGWFKT